ncbi:MAG: hypothetical protein JSW35_02015 [Deltaproteobacteria bacterium]|nr:MAG: hypothetical protein JSW35_02015 [Deltaproteobacteria bacterium]
MNLKAKIYVENQKKTAHGKLAARLAFLNEKGLDGGAIQRDSMIRKLRAEIRKANYRLTCVAAQEKLNAERLAAKKSLRERPPAEPVKEVPGKKGKKEKKKEPSPASKAQE